jgi:hypothetical protein
LSPPKLIEYTNPCCQVKHDDFPSFSDRFITQTSTPIGKDDLNVSNVTATIDPVVSSLQQEIKNLREIIISLQDKANKKCDPMHQQTNLALEYLLLYLSQFDNTRN